MNVGAKELKHDIGEQWLAKRVGDFGGVFEGITDPALRRERIRSAIVEQHLELAIIGKGRGGKAETFSQAFERLYGQRLARP